MGMTKCPHCNKDLCVNENGECEYCGSYVQTDSENPFESINRYKTTVPTTISKGYSNFGLCVKNFSIGLLIVGIIGSIMIATSFFNGSMNWIVLIYSIFISIISFIFIYGMGEILDLLASINEKLKN